MYKPFRAALQAIREELLRAGDRHPDLFYENLMKLIPCEGNGRFWQDFIKKNSQEGGAWQEWYTPDEECGRLYGDAAGAKEFKPLAESLYLVLYEMGESLYGGADGGFYECLQFLLDAATKYPTPLLRTKVRYWGSEKEALTFRRDSQEGESRIAHSFSINFKVGENSVEFEEGEGEDIVRIGFAHNVFTAAVAFIDTILDSRRALLVGYSFTDSPPIALPADDEDKEALSIEQEAAAEKPKTSPYVFRFDEKKKEWYLRFLDEEDTFDDLVGLRMYHKLLLAAVDRTNVKALSGLELKSSPEIATLRQAKPERRFHWKTRKQYEDRQAELPELIEAEEQAGHSAKAGDLKDELLKLNQMLKKDVGAFHRAKALGHTSPAERARKAVGNAMDTASEKIGDKMPQLRDHFVLKIKQVWGESKWFYEPTEGIEWDL